MRIEKSRCQDYKQILVRFSNGRDLLIQFWGYRLWKYGSKFRLDKWEYYPYMTYSLDLFGLSILYRRWANRSL